MTIQTKGSIKEYIDIYCITIINVLHIKDCNIHIEKWFFFVDDHTENICLQMQSPDMLCVNVAVLLFDSKWLPNKASLTFHLFKLNESLSFDSTDSFCVYACAHAISLYTDKRFYDCHSNSIVMIEDLYFPVPSPFPANRNNVTRWWVQVVL